MFEQLVQIQPHPRPCFLLHVGAEGGGRDRSAAACRIPNNRGEPYAITLPDALEALSRLCMLRYPTNKSKETVTKLPHPDQAQERILQALKITLPKM